MGLIDFFKSVKIYKLVAHRNMAKDKLENGEFLMNSAGSMKDALYASRQISERINKPGAKVWHDGFITITFPYQGKFKTNRSRVNFWFNNCG